MKIAYCNSFGGWTIHHKVLNYLQSRFIEEGIDCDVEEEFGKIPQHHPLLIEALEKYIDLCEGVGIYETQDDKYFITDYDVRETVHTPSNIDWIYGVDLNGFVTRNEKVVFQDNEN